jgi:hypothetical protein
LIILAGRRDGKRVERRDKKIKFPCRRVIIMAENLETWNISSSDPYSYELPSAISAPKVKDLWWAGDPVDFSYLNPGMLSLVKASF